MTNINEPNPPKELVYCLAIIIGGMIMLAAYLKIFYP